LKVTGRGLTTKQVVRKKSEEVPRRKKRQGRSLNGVRKSKSVEICGTRGNLQFVGEWDTVRDEKKPQ